MSVNVSMSSAVPYTWTNAGFTWSEATAGKLWSAADQVVYGLAVDTNLTLAELRQGAFNKAFASSMNFMEMPSRQSMLQFPETFAVSETYSDLIAFVLRFVESLGFGEVASRMGAKQLSESVGFSDGLNRLMTIIKSESIGFAETYSDLIAFFLRITENLSFGEVAAKNFTKPSSESFVLSDEVKKTSIKRVSEAISLAEILGRTVAYKLWLNEGLAFTESLQRAQQLNFHEALALAEQYRRRANGVVSDMIVSTLEITERDFMNILESGHPPGYTNFRDFIQGDYSYQRALFRAILESHNADRGYIDGLRVTVDVPDVFDRGTAQIVNAANGITVVFSRTFRVAPEVTLTHKGGTSVAIPRLLGSVSTTGFTAILENSTGTRVTGSLSWVAQGY